VQRKEESQNYEKILLKGYQQKAEVYEDVVNKGVN
jgi:hypothetical protein